MSRLGNAGKAILIYIIKQTKEVESTIPTMGMTIEKAQCANFNICLWDIGKRSVTEFFLNFYLESADGLIFVGEGSDIDQIDDAFQDILPISKMLSLPVLIVANKIDLPMAVTIAELANKLNAHSTPTLNWHTHGISILKRIGLDDA